VPRPPRPAANHPRRMMWSMWMSSSPLLACQTRRRSMPRKLEEVGGGVLRSLRAARRVPERVCKRPRACASMWISAEGKGGRKRNPRCRECVNLASLLRRWCLAIDSGIGLQACVVASPSVPWPHAQCAACVFVRVGKQREKKPSYKRGVEGGRRQHPKAKAPAKLKSKALVKLASPALTAKR